ncbi:MAG: hypothetical protein PUF97_02015 [Bifidobacteriaceae bacterium]|nr:hypothetical protein [Bifidobacteriaceae bacterium]
MAKDTTGRDLVRRPRYLDVLRRQMHTPDIKVLVGGAPVRQVLGAFHVRGFARCRRCGEAGDGFLQTA